MAKPDVPEDDLFCIQIDFEKHSEGPSRVFKSMVGLIESFETLDQSILRGISLEAKPVAILEDVETGSLRAWIRTHVEKVPDDVLDSGDWKKGVGRLLKRTKYWILDWAQDKNEVIGISQIQEIRANIGQIIQEELPTFGQANSISVSELLVTVRKMSESLQYLGPSETAVAIIDDDQVVLNREFRPDDKVIQELLSKEKLKSTTEVILKVKKPDFLGQSQWEFRSGDRSICANITDANWLDSFQSGRISIVPGDALRVMLMTELVYGYDNELIATHSFVVQVIEVLHQPKMEQLSLPEFTDE